MRWASALSWRARSASRRPKASWVDISRAAGAVKRSGTGTDAARRRRGPPFAKGTPERKALRSAAGSAKPAKGSHSAPAAMPLAAWKPAICSAFMRPAWLSLWPAKGRPWPLMV